MGVDLRYNEVVDVEEFTELLHGEVVLYTAIRVLTSGSAGTSIAITVDIRRWPNAPLPRPLVLWPVVSIRFPNH